MDYQIIQTADGSKTLYLPAMNEQFHSVNGAFTESEYVFTEKGYLFHPAKNPVVFEVGFGTGLNCLLTAILAEKTQRPTTFFTIEKYPLDNHWLEQLNYGSLISVEAKNIFATIHSCEWGKTVRITNHFSLHKINADLSEISFSEFAKFDVIYFDAFGPDKQPEMWEPAIFRKIFEQCSDGSVFVTYSAKGEVRRRLSAAGFTMERLPGPPGKKEMLRGIKNISNL
ncbi:MAG: SAM-dependent methyltransferase [Bacteroidia bacterium]|nr:SAM-dependent methyltransferase [Bacteroidia bacterium]